MLISNFLERQKNNNTIAIKYGDDNITYSEWFDKSKAVSKMINELKVDSLKTLAIFLPNSINYAIAYFGILFSNKVIVPIDVKSTDNEIYNIFQYCEIDVVVTDNNFINKIISKSSLINHKINIINIDNNCNILFNQDCTLLKKSTSSELDDVVILLHTSGTTDNPKRVMLTHENLYRNVISNIDSLSLTRWDKFLISLPMQFGYCNTAQFLTAAYLGASIVIFDSVFNSKRFFELVQKEKVTIYTSVPTILSLILKYKYCNNYDISSLKYLCFGGGFISNEIILTLQNKFPSVGFVQTYGMTECAPRVTVLLPQYLNAKIGSVGLPIPGVMVKVVDENGHEVINENGEICVKGKNVMKGYYKNPQATKEKINDGWLKTGDIGYIDNDNFLYITGRIKNIIISGGVNIYPEEIEQVISSHPDVSEVLVYGKYDEMLGEIPCAKIVKTNDSITKDIIKSYCLQRLSVYKVPKDIEFIDYIDKTYNGKIKRT